MSRCQRSRQRPANAAYLQRASAQAMSSWRRHGQYCSMASASSLASHSVPSIHFDSLASWLAKRNFIITLAFQNRHDYAAISPARMRASTVFSILPRRHKTMKYHQRRRFTRAKLALHFRPAARRARRASIMLSHARPARIGALIISSSTVASAPVARIDFTPCVPLACRPMPSR